MEDCKQIEILGEVQQIYKVLSKDPMEKMPFQGIEIAKTLSRTPFFKRFFDTNSQQFIALCISQDVVQAHTNTSIYNTYQFRNQRFLYIILEGSVGIYSPQGSLKKLGLLGVFGQTQILFDIPRKQTAKVLSSCKLMRIKQNSLLQLWNKTDDLKKCLKFLNINRYFQRLNELQKMNLCLFLEKQLFQANETIKPEKQIMKNIFFFIYGKVSVQTKITKGSSEKQYSIDCLQELSSYGEYECLMKEPTRFKLKGIVPGAYYKVDYHELVKAQHFLVQLIQEKACPYPDIEELTFLQEVKSTLRKQEEKIRRKIGIPFKK